MIRRHFHIITSSLLMLATLALAAETTSPPLKSTLKDAKGENVGVANLTDTPNGVLIEVEFAKMPPGEHAFHIHETGKCEPPFKSAGEHFNPTGKKHGFGDAGGYHAGDMPNIIIPDSGTTKVRVFLPDVRLNSGTAKLLDNDGSALVVHAGVDDYQTDPAGNAGDRIACGVIERENVSVEGLEVAP